MKFYLPEVKWSPAPYASFDVISQGLLAVIKANPALAQKNAWPTTLPAVEDWVDLFNATVCSRMGWEDYILTDVGGNLPKSPAPPHQAQSLSGLAAAAAKVKALVSGAKTLMEWVESNDPAVDSSLATARALTCSQCPKNERGDWTDWFTVPTAELIRRMVAKAEARKLTTPSDDRLHCCTACYCPMKLKVHVPIEWILKRQTPEEVTRLKQGKNCWVVAEGKL
jgi:hypothetical protein